MNDAQLQEQIWSEFRDKLRARGVTDLKFEKRTEMPEAEEIAQQCAWLERLGPVGRYTVWLVKKAFQVIAGFVIIMSAPEAWERFQVYFPDTYEVVVNMGELFDQGQLVLSTPRPAPFDIGLGGQYYIAYDPDWRDDRELFEGDVYGGSDILYEGRRVMLFATRATPDCIVLNSTTATTLPPTTEPPPEEDLA